MSVNQTVETIARDSYGRLLAYLATRLSSIELAEDALSEAFLKALKNWPEKGLPKNPEAWLLLTARNRLIDLFRSEQKAEELLSFLEEPIGEFDDEELLELKFPDERLKLLFVCAHPAIESGIHTPLMLQLILGLNAAQIASAFLTSPTAMSQRLVRAKNKIQGAGISFDLPQPQDLPARAGAVLEAIYTLYNTGWGGLFDDASSKSHEFRQEALYLAELCADLMPQNAEAKGLLALILYCESRKAARNTEGHYVPLSEQNVNLWSRKQIDAAEQALVAAATMKQPGRFQLEAAIQSVHAGRVFTGKTNWEAVVNLYEVLLSAFPSTGAQIGYCAALAELKGASAGLELLNDLASEDLKDYQPYWALKAHLLKTLNKPQEASAAYMKAIGLTECPAVKRFLMKQVKLLE